MAQGLLLICKQEIILGSGVMVTGEDYGTFSWVVAAVKKVAPKEMTLGQ